MPAQKYTDHRVVLTKDQLEDIIFATKKRKCVTIRLLPSFAATNDGETHIVTLPLTQSQLLLISQTRKSKFFNLTLSVAQLDHLVKSGGFLPLLALLPLLFGGIAAAGGVSGGIASIVSAASNSKASAAAQAESERHNREIEAQLKSGSGACACSHGKKSGSGIISDKIQNIPLLGALAPYLRKIGLGACECRDILDNKLVHTKHGLEAKLGYGIFLGSRGDGIFVGPLGKGIFLGPQGFGFGPGPQGEGAALGRSTDYFLGPQR